MEKEQLTIEGGVLFLISPNFGLLDNWLPVLSALKEQKPGIRITAVIPKIETVSEINPEETMARLGTSLFTKVLVRTRAGFWVGAESLVHAKELIEKAPKMNLVIGKVRTALHLSRRSRALKPIATLLDHVVRFVAPVLTGETYTSIESIKKEVKAICFDLYGKTKNECHEVLDFFPTTPRFSIWHGVGVPDFPVKGGDYDRGRMYPVTAYLNSEHEREAYKSNYALSNGEIKVVGVPRYEERWIKKILQTSKKDIPGEWDRYLFIVSRPASNFFPREKKRAALEQIRKLALEDLHCKIVIKLRLSEYTKKDGVYEEVLGESSYGKEWIYSSSHPFVLGRSSLFGITFYSGVAIDLLALGVPTVQMVELKSGGKSGKIMEYPQKGLVLGAKTYEELKAHADRILREKERILAPLVERYNEFFRPVGAPIATIVEDIVAVL